MLDGDKRQEKNKAQKGGRWKGVREERQIVYISQSSERGFSEEVKFEWRPEGR